MRGKVYPEMNEKIKDRITPACAGKSKGLSEKLAEERDHPRVCGEKLDFLHLPHVQLGSPPRVRGKESGEEKTYYSNLITPACAGKRVFLDGSSTMDEDHPRVCGEKLVYHLRERGV